MIELQGIGLRDVVYFKKADVRLNENGITFVRGLNLDSDPAAPSSNGAGKSLLFSCPSNVLYFSPPLAIKKKAKKELLSKGSSISLALKAADGHEYVVEQKASKYTITRDGKDLELRTVPLAEKFIREKLFPLSELVYYTTGYVSTQRPFPMQNDSDSDRLSHLSELFQLDDYDHIRRFFLNRLGEVRDSELQLQVLERDLIENKARLKKAKSRTSDKAGLKALQANKEVLDKKIASYVDTEFAHKTLLKNLTTLLTVERELDALRESYKSKMPPKDYAIYLRNQRKLVRATEAYQSELASYTKTVKNTQAKLDELKLPDVSRTKIDKRLKAAETALDGLQEELQGLKTKRRSYEEAKAARAELLDELKELGYGPKNKPDLDANYDEDIASCTTTLKLQKLIEHSHDDDGTCPTCMSPVDLDNIKGLVKKAKKDLPRYKAKKAAQSLWTKYKAADEKYKELEYKPEAEEKLRSRITAAGPIIEDLKNKLKIWERHEHYSKMLADVEKPKAPSDKPEVDLSVEQIDDVIELCSDIIKNLEARNKLIESEAGLDGLRTVKAVKKKVTSVEADLESVQKALKAKRLELSNVVTELDTANAVAHEIEVHEKAVARTSQKIDELRPLIEDKRLLEVMAKAYSTKGLKTIVANSICGLLEQNLNAYSNLIFNEPFVFSVVAQDSGLSILVDRGNGIVSDVRNLSGAESNAYRLLFVASLLPLVPDDRRINTLTLDEPCSHMDEVSRTKFLTVFLPALAEIVPNIFVITPNPEDYCEGSVQWVVRKSRGKSTVIIDGSVDLAEPDMTEVVKAVKAKKRATKTEKTKETTKRKKAA